MICIFNLVLLTSIFAGQVRSTNQPGCLTWEVHAGYLNLTCRLENFVQPVTLIDNHEKAHISCTLKKAKHKIGCIPKKRRKHISFDSSLQTVTFTIKNKYSNYVDGMWKCQQGCNSYETEVSTTKGIIDSTDISLYGELINNDAERKVKLKCVSCRAPRRNHAEFLINGSSDTSIVYNKIDGKCIHNNVDCEPHVCSCTGNEFIHTFPVTSLFGTNYTCDMIFNDNDKGSKFSKNTTLYFNGKQFLKEGLKKDQDKEHEETVDQKTRNLQDKSKNTECKYMLPDFNSQIPLTLYIMVIYVVNVVVAVVGVVIVIMIYCYTGRGTTKKQDSSVLTVDSCTEMGDRDFLTSVETTDSGTVTDESDFLTSVLTVDSGISMDDSDFLASEETTDSGLAIGRRNFFVQCWESFSASEICEPCNVQHIKTHAVYLCLSCNECMCKKCKINHSVMKHFRGHSILEIASLPEKIRLLQPCPIHEKYTDEFFCGDHKRLCCRQCAITRHRQCVNIKTIEDVAEDFGNSGELALHKRNLQRASDGCDKLEMFINATTNTKVSDSESIFNFIHKRRPFPGGNQNYNEIELTAFADQSETQLQSDSFKTQNKQNTVVILENKTRIVRLKKVFDCLPKMDSILETELFILVQRSKEFLTGIEADLNTIIRDSKLTDDITDFRHFTQIVLKQNVSPPDFKVILSRENVKK